MVKKKKLSKLEKYLSKKIVNIEIEEEHVGGACIDACKTPITDATIEKAKKSDAVLLGAVGGPKWDNLPFNQRPEQGLLKLRSNLQLFAYCMKQKERINRDFFRFTGNISKSQAVLH